MRQILLYLTYAWCAGFAVIVALSIAKYIRRRKRERYLAALSTVRECCARDEQKRREA